MNVAARLEILSAELPGCCCLHRHQPPLAFTFLREEREEAGPHLIQLVKLASSNFPNLTSFVTASSRWICIYECGVKKGGLQGSLSWKRRAGHTDTTGQLVNPGFCFFGLLVHLCMCAYHKFPGKIQLRFARCWSICL